MDWQKCHDWRSQAAYQQHRDLYAWHRGQFGAMRKNRRFLILLTPDFQGYSLRLN